MTDENHRALEAALAAFKSRREASSRQVRIDNGALPAGSPMFFYCHSCGVNHATLREDYEVPPPHHCRDCRAMMELTKIVQAAEEAP